MLETDGNFYLGRVVNAQTHQTSNTKLHYDADDLTTHGVVVGMTGSGKTGLCLDLLEEAALNHIPALMVDPKGDITNALLHFPNLAPTDFEPWLNATEARRDGKTITEAATETAALWRNGLAQWDILPERIKQLQESAQFTIYTPGSDAGLPISILASLKAPEIDWQSNKELLREKISGTVTAILGLIGLKNIDPVRSREHILLANIFEQAWAQGQDLDLSELIMQTQAPPFEKLGVFPIDRFFPEKDRFELAMSLNNLLAAPAFQTWIEGEPLDVARLLYMPDGTPRHTIFYIAHLNDAERMFFVTLLFSAVETWVRSLSGTVSLRALVYFDEIFGYLPPVGNPPSKEPMLRLLKQARAFGVGLLLATQNPVDIDYKALSNAGTWFIGKLGTEQDKQRLLDGLASAIPGGLDRSTYDHLISALGKRVFLLRNVHDKQPTLFQTRWAMNYLAGPITRNQIPALNSLAGVGAITEVPTAVSAVSPPTTTETQMAAPAQSMPTTTRPPIPNGINEYFLPIAAPFEAIAIQNNLPPTTPEGKLLYRPALLAQAKVRYLNRKYNLDHSTQTAALVKEPNPRHTIQWHQHAFTLQDARQLERAPISEANYADLGSNFTNKKAIRAWQTDFVDWIYHTANVTVQANETLKLYAGPDMPADEFKRQCYILAEEKMEAEEDKVAERYEKKLETIAQKLEKEERELIADKAEYRRRQQEEALTHAETLLSLFAKRRRSLSTSMSKRRRSDEAKEDVKESEAEIERLNQALEELEQEMKNNLDEVEAKWYDLAKDIHEIAVTPYKKDIDVTRFGLVWLPYYVVQVGGHTQTFAAFANKQ